MNFFLFGGQAFAQTPQYEYGNLTPGSGGASGMDFREQCLYTRANFPTMPAGQVKAIYIRPYIDYNIYHNPGETCRLEGFYAAIGNVHDTAFKPIDSFKTGLTAIYGPDTFTIPCSGHSFDWIRIPVTKGSFYYNPEGAKFAVEIALDKQVANPSLYFPLISCSINGVGYRSNLVTLDGRYKMTANAQASRMDLGIDFVTTGVNNATSKLAAFGLFPNPAIDGRFNVSVEGKQSLRNIDIKVRNALGQEVYQTNYTNASSLFFKEVNLGSVAAGVYFLEINADGERLVRRVLVE